MSFTVMNPTDRPIYADTEGTRHTIEPGEAIEVESHRDALNLQEYGALLSGEERVAAIVAEDERVARERYLGEGERSGGPQATVLPRETAAVVAVEDVPRLKGVALNAALKANGLSVDGKVDDKRERLSAHLSQHATGEQKSGPEVILGDASDPAGDLSDEEVTEALVALEVEVDDELDADGRRALLRESLPS